MDSHQAHLTIPTSARYVRPSLEFLIASSKEMGIDNEDRSRLITIADAVLETLVEHGSKGAFVSDIRIALRESHDGIAIEFLNKGLPLLSAMTGLRRRLVSRAAVNPEEIAVQNLGRGGQRLLFRLKSFTSDTRSEANVPESPPSFEEEIQVRRINRGEEDGVNELFFNVYEYNYINDAVYFPERLREMLEDGRLISFVAVNLKGHVVGHVGLVRLGEFPRVYEAALGVIDPRIKSRKLFTRLFQFAMGEAAKLTMSYCVFDFVTNHNFSQKLVSHYGPQDMAILVGCQSKSTQASLGKLGLGTDPDDMDRYSLLVSILPKETHPFGREIRLPSNLGEMLEFILKPLHIGWIPAPRFDLMPRDGEFQSVQCSQQKALTFDLARPGRTAVHRLADLWRQAKREGYHYAGVNVPVSAPGLGDLYDSLAAHGFFVGGFVPYRNTGELALRLQALGPSRVAFDKIQVRSEVARKLLACVEADYKRNSLL